MQLGAWSIDSSVAYVVVAGGLYSLGGRRASFQPRRLQTASFFAGLGVIALALYSPIDYYAETLFWVHMLQHVLLLTAAPPLILLGRPWPRMWRALPIGLRTTVGRALARSGVAAPLRAVARPLPAWVLFNGCIVAWHIPALYNATLSSDAIHQLEHAMFFFTGLLFWARVIDPGPLRPRLHWPLRIAYVTGAMVVGFGLALTLVLAPHPLYAHYASLIQRPGGLTALDDQQIAGGMMWVPGSISYAVAALIGFYRWLEPQSRTPPSDPVAILEPETPTPPPQPVLSA